MSTRSWPYPGSRWWKFDFHTHTPASTDFGKGPNQEQIRGQTTPKDWLLAYMQAGLDCVAVTDHNSGVWIDKLKDTYAEMQAQAKQGKPPSGFREITIFPGVEISANGGVHVLAIFDPSCTTSDIDSLLGAADYRSPKGGGEGETQKAVNEVIAKIVEAGAIPIPAHADRDKGLLHVNPGTRECTLSSATVKLALESEGLLAVEWCDLNSPYPQAVEKLAQPLARVLGSDCHSFRGKNPPGSNYTWVKMATPTLEGLRLALLDGEGVSIRRSDAGQLDPFKTPADVIRAIEVEKARVMGNGRTARVELSPYFNAIVGGRGTGKSTLVHALRLATGREGEVMVLPEDSEPREHFESFRAVAKGRDDKGAVKPETCFRVEWQHERAHLRLSWSPSGPAGQSRLVEDLCNQQWQHASSQSVNPDRFPIRIFSQGQIAAMVGGGRQALLGIIDEAAKVEPLKQAFEEAQRTFFAQRARLREIDGKLATLPEVERRLQEAENKLKALAQGDNAAVKQAYARAQQQKRAVEEILSQLRKSAAGLRDFAKELLLDDWMPQHFTEADADLLAWRQEAAGLLESVRNRLLQEADALEQGIAHLDGDARLAAWRARFEAACNKHVALQAQLAAQGVPDPEAFQRLTHHRQELEMQRKDLRQLQLDRDALLRQIEEQQALLLQRRQNLTAQRRAFLEEKLAQNPYVRMEVVAFGFDPTVIERSLRELIDVTDERFADDILVAEEGRPPEGLAAILAGAANKPAALKSVKEKLIQIDESLHGKFRNFLSKRWEKPELADHVLAWFPEDDLKIEYQREGKWHAISEASQGQRSAALLAFLLAFGEEPLVLDQPEDDLDNHLIYDLIVRQIRENKLRRQLIVVTHNPNVVVNGDAEVVHVMDFGRGQCFVKQSGALQEKAVRGEICQVMEGGREAFERRWKRLGREV
ncbi:MAG TPA: AAA family ATPase [Verrucomicrobiota bacterium]|nr:AAA family ATPase [Verrucomicrobiota bacterium]HRT56886.1 AAA family ATPase [Candidatus Paceibacterota bacterium]